MGVPTSSGTGGQSAWWKQGRQGDQALRATWELLRLWSPLLQLKPQAGSPAADSTSKSLAAMAGPIFRGSESVLLLLVHLNLKTDHVFSRSTRGQKLVPARTIS